MKYIRKTAASSLIAALAFLAGSFCLHPMSAQAMAATPAMAMEGHALDADALAVTGDNTPVSAWNLCVVNCASQPAQAVIAKKFSADSGIGFLADIAHYQTLHFSVSSSGPTDISGTHPPSPDILFSVFKKE